MPFGLTQKEIKIIKSVFEKTPEIENVFVYGSRAKGSFKKTSDIDFGVHFAKNNPDGILKLKSELNDLPIIYEIDATDEKEIQKGNFKTEYEKTKQLFYQK